jgi:histidine triad (HIT) family protein
MKAYLNFAFKVSFIATLVFAFIEWRIPGFVSYVFPFYWFFFVTAVLGILSTFDFKPSTMSCLFCQIVSGEVPALKIYENDKALAFLDVYPVSKGHTLVIPKTHARDLAAGSTEDAMELMKVIHDLAPKIVKALGASGYNLGMNHGPDAGQEIFHTHIHIMPRFNGDARKFEKTHPSKEELTATAEEIRAKM